MTDDGLRRLRRQLGEEDATPIAWRAASDYLQDSPATPSAEFRTRPEGASRAGSVRIAPGSNREVSGSYHIPFIVFLVLHLLFLTRVGFPEVSRIPFFNIFDNFLLQFQALYGAEFSRSMIIRVMPAIYLWPTFALALVWALVPRLRRGLPWIIVIIPGALLALSLFFLMISAVQGDITEHIGSLSVSIILLALIASDVSKARRHRIKRVDYSSAITAWLWWVIVIFPVPIALGRILRNSAIPRKIALGEELGDVINFGNLAFHWATGVAWVIVVWAGLKMLLPPYNIKSELRLFVIASLALIVYYSVIVSLLPYIQF